MVARRLALLRGINVGGKNKLAMRDLAGMFIDAGCRDVSTYIQSGNVVFNAASTLASRVPSLIAGEIEKRFGYRTPVVLRTAGQVGDVLANNPFLTEGATEDNLHVLFLADLPNPAHVAELDSGRSPPDSFAVRGPEIYLRLPNGAGNTKLTNAWFDSKLKTVSTGRNWRTVKQLFALMNA